LRSSTAAFHTATARRAPTHGTCPIRSRCTASRSIRQGPKLVAKYPTLPDATQFRVPNVGFSVQKAAVDKGLANEFPLILTSGRLVRYEGGGEETRSNKWLAELQQDMSSRSIPPMPQRAASRTAAGLGDGCRE